MRFLAVIQITSDGFAHQFYCDFRKLRCQSFEPRPQTSCDVNLLQNQCSRFALSNSCERRYSYQYWLVLQLGWQSRWWIASRCDAFDFQLLSSGAMSYRLCSLLNAPSTFPVTALVQKASPLRPSWYLGWQKVLVYVVQCNRSAFSWFSLA